ncbi:hypothetical protein HELRODRAFT_167261 [Helobdella robusta]|uniref:Uncharacterized protein n=1 Tax=Helobdella robusta TaxID=6412 RepID=T1EZ67_HELRO|nr:hypothetical protein HELRODRAFT_167261 [Helobdella robusta]ESO10763.1 hypothetical protein HELRODRAFT_167261 [Helobdella robusta]
MVVEILEEKLDREYCDNAAKLMIQSGVAESSSSSSSSSSGHHHHQDQRNDVTVRCRRCGGSGSDDEVYDSCRHHGGHDQRCDIFRNLPQSWEPMSNNETFKCKITILRLFTFLVVRILYL